MHGKNNMNENSLIESLKTVQHCLDINFTSFEKLMLYFTDDKEFLKFIWNFKLKFGIILKWERVLRFKTPLLKMSIHIRNGDKMN